MEKLDKICGDQISFETSAQKLLKEVLWSKDVAGKKRSSPAGEKVGKKSAIWDQKHLPSFSPHTNQVFKPLHLIQEIYLAKKRNKNKYFIGKKGFLVVCLLCDP